MLAGNPFTTGGPVPPQDKTKIYVLREADNKLLDNCLNGEYSAVLTARQMGKTSLLDHTIEELKKFDIGTSRIDLQGIGAGNVTADEWYQSFLSILVSSFNLDISVEEWWKKNIGLSLNLKFRKFITDILLTTTTSRIVIFIDEIELITQLEESVSDSFFAVIRSLYTGRGTETDLRRISFVLLGMAQISDLIRHSDITTFNIGKRIELESFTAEEIIPLVQTISSKASAKELSDWIIEWTGGQPYLTQLVCERLSQLSESVESKKVVDTLVESLISEHDPDLYGMHIVTIGKNIASKPFNNLLLGVYALVAKGEQVFDLEESNAVRHLKLFGLVVSHKGILKINNDIYRHVFDSYWIERQLRNLGIPTNLDQTARNARAHLVETSPLAGSRSILRRMESNELQQESKLTDIVKEPIPPSGNKIDEVSVESYHEASEKMEEKPSVETEDESWLFERLLRSVEVDEKKEKAQKQILTKDKRPLTEDRAKQPGHEKEASPKVQEAEVHNKVSISETLIQKLKVFFDIFRDKRATLAILAVVIAIAIISWGLFVHSTTSLLVSGGLLLVILLIAGIVVSINSERSLVEERLGHFLDEDQKQVSDGEEAGRFIVTEWMNRRVAISSMGDRVARELARADLKFKVVEYYALIFISIVAVAAIAYLIQPFVVSLVIGGVIGTFIPRFYVKRQQVVRLNKFNDQLTNMLTLMVNGLRAGYSTMQAIEAVGRELPAPISDEFRRVSQEMQIGISMEKALENLLRRVPSEDFDFVVTALNVQREVGGNLSEILDDIRIRILDRKRLASEGRKIVLSSFDFFYISSIVVVIVQHIVFPDAFELISRYSRLQASISLLLIVWSLILIVMAAISRKIFQLFDHYRFILIWDIVSLALVFLIGVPQPLVVWLLIMLLSLFLGTVISGIAWVIVTVIFFQSIDFLSFSFDFERVQIVVGVLNRITQFFSAFQHYLVLPIAQSKAIPIQSLVIVISLIVLVGAVAVVIASLRRNDQDDDSDPLQARLAEFIQRGDVTSLEDIELSVPFSERVTVPIVRKVGELSVRFTPQWAIQNASRRMELAGNPWPIDAATFFALRFVLAIVFGGLAVAFILISPPADSSMNLFYIGGATFLGSYIPVSMLTSRIRNRQKEVRNAMPDALYLLTICVEAGLGFEAAMSKLSEKWDNELSLAFAITLREIQLGKVRREALKDLSDRIGLPELTLFVAAIVQSEQLGVSMAKVLRIQSNDMFVARREKILYELSRLDLASKTLFFILFGLVFVFWFLWPVLAQLSFFH